MNANQTSTVVAASAFAAGLALTAITIKITKKAVARAKQNNSNDLWEKATDRTSSI